MTTATKQHYHFDQVGSYLRPAALKEARAAFAAGDIDHETLLQVQHDEIHDLVLHQAAVGLKDVTDGEFARSWWHLDFLWGLNGAERYSQEDSYKFHGAATRTDNVRLTGKLAFNPDHPFFAGFEYLQSVAPAGTEPKSTIPAPTLFFRDGRSDRALDFYDTWEDYLDGLAETYRQTLQHFYDLGSRYVQLDDTTWAFLIAKLNEFSDDPVERAKYEKIAEDSVYVINKVLDGLPADFRISTHICRGNYKSTYLFEGGYAPVAKYLGQLHYDTFFLEFDDERSGDFTPLADIFAGREDVLLVLGLVTSKSPKLETADEIKARINDATQYVPLENLALSTQCGFASTEEGNALTEDEQWAKLGFIKSVADEIWG
jgi:methionine synthase II (cobalamin-independent)